jgi:predicted  nucleic acid-binding Zn-ribbon protein
MIGEQDRRTLLTLRTLDRDADRFQERAQVIPRELERLEKELSVHQELLDEEERRLQDLRLDRRAAEREVEQAKSKRREMEAKQFQIRNNQEYQASLREIETMRERASQYDERALEILMQEEEIQKEVDRLGATVAEERKKYDVAVARLRAELAEVRQVLGGKDKERLGTIERLTPSLRTKYERIRRNKGGVAIVGVDGGACGGCGYALPPQRIQEVRRNRDLILCEGCGRILIWVGDDFSD